MDVCAAPTLLLLLPLLLPLHHHPESRQKVGSTSAIVCLANGRKRSQPKGFKKKQKHREIIKGIDAGAAVHAGIKAELFSKATDSEEEEGKRPRSKNATAHVPGKHV